MKRPRVRKDRPIRIDLGRKQYLLIQQSSEEEPLGVILDVYDTNDDLITSFTHWYDDAEAENDLYSPRRK